jgi:hypothetical protein
MGQAQTGRHCHTYENGDTYDGDFLNGKRHGSGVYTSTAGHRYEGSDRSKSWLAKIGRDRSEQQLTRVNDALFLCYLGEWKNDMREGYGVLSFTDPYKDGSVELSAWAGT